MVRLFFLPLRDMEFRRIELLAPARDYETAIAAIDCGADAVYMGAARFGARRAAGNSIEDIGRTVSYAHSFGVRVYATLNTVLFDDELADAERLARGLIDAGVDALIVQDMAYMEMGLDVEMHASTQMYNISPERVAFLESCGFSRVVLERGLTLEQIKSVRKATSVDLECFIHGAICVCGSGRCYMSRTMSGRSGNRGECSQPCRMTYDLTDGSGHVVVRGKHLLSLHDLDLSARLGELLDAGVNSFKIEGRLKDTGYVKNTVAFYRRALDREIAVRSGLVRSSVGESAVDFEPDLSKSFSRGGTEYFLDGVSRGVASFDTPKSLGSLLGRVVAGGEGWFELEKGIVPATGDGICFMRNGELIGTSVNGIEGKRIFTSRATPLYGTAVFRNYDRCFVQQLSSSRTRRSVQVVADVEAGLDVLKVRFTECRGNSIVVTEPGPFELARDPGRMVETLKNQLSRCGDTIFRMTGVRVSVGDGKVPFVPTATVNAIRRKGLEMLYDRLSQSIPEGRRIGLDQGVSFPGDHIDGAENVTNRLSERFYRRHGVRRIEPGFDLSEDLSGCTVMRTPYCIRREIGRCLKETDGLPGPLYLEHGSKRYRLVFDCAACEMMLVYEKDQI